MNIDGNDKLMLSGIDFGISYSKLRFRNYKIHLQFSIFPNWKLMKWFYKELYRKEKVHEKGALNHFQWNRVVNTWNIE